MQRLRMLGTLLAALAALCASSHAATEFVVVNNNSTVANSAIMYKLERSTGQLIKVAVLHTGGQGAGVATDFSQVEQAVTEGAGCIFAFDTATSDIATFSKAAGYERVGKYFDSNLIAGPYGGTLALTPNNKFLYATYSETLNLGAWRIHPDCTLTFIAVTNFSAGPIRVTPNGKTLIASSGGSGAEEFAIDKLTGNLVDLGGVTFHGGACARENVCTPFGLDITKDSKLAVFASYAPNITRQYDIPVALTARITATGLTNPRTWNLKNSTNMYNNIFPFLSSAAYAGSGNLYFGVQGQSGGGGTDPGVLTASFTEHPLSIKLKSATVVNAPQRLDGNIAVTGDLMMIAEYPNQIEVFRINSDGSLTSLSTTTIDDQGEGLFSLSVFPNTR
jgi:hypothetical protein